MGTVTLAVGRHRREVVRNVILVLSVPEKSCFPSSALFEEIVNQEELVYDIPRLLFER